MVLDVEQGAQLFNMAAAMSDERFDEAHDENATYADQEQIRRHQARMVRSVSPAQQDDALLSMQASLGDSSQQARVGTREWKPTRLM